MTTTQFGKVLRKIRVDLDLTLKEVADNTRSTSAYLSAVETGRKPLNSDLVQQVLRFLEQQQGFRNEHKQALLEASAQTIKEVRVPVTNKEQLAAVMAFARKVEAGNVDAELLKRLQET